MTKEKEIEILMKDRCTKGEAEKFLKTGTIIIPDFEERLEEYLEEWGFDEEEKEQHRNMVKTQDAIPSWGIVEDEGKRYYIVYVN